MKLKNKIEIQDKFIPLFQSRHILNIKNHCILNGLSIDDFFNYVEDGYFKRMPIKLKGVFYEWSDHYERT